MNEPVYDDPITEQLYQRMAEYFGPAQYDDRWRLNLNDLTQVVKDVLADDLEERAANYDGAAAIYAERGRTLGPTVIDWSQQSYGKAILLEQEATALRFRAEQLRKGKA